MVIPKKVEPLSDATKEALNKMVDSPSAIVAYSEFTQIEEK